jgi:hypothetical protein
VPLKDDEFKLGLQKLLLEIARTEVGDDDAEPYPEWGYAYGIKLFGEHITLSIDIPHSPDDLEAGLKVENEFRQIHGLDDLHETIELMTRAAIVCERFMDTDVLEKFKEHQQKEQEAAEAEKQKRIDLLAERKDRLLNEFVDEQGRIRVRAHRRWRPVKVVVENMSRGDEPDYQPVFYYTNERHGYREFFNLNIVSFEIKRGKRYYSVWDDGYDDLPEYHRPTSPRPVYGKDD